MAEIASETLSQHQPISKENPARNILQSKQHALTELTRRAQERRNKPLFTLAEKTPSSSQSPERPTSEDANLALMGVSSLGIMYHEMGHQMTKTHLDLNRKN